MIAFTSQTDLGPQAHAAYWNDPSFSSFIQMEIFATKVDLLRTSIGTGAL